MPSKAPAGNVAPFQNNLIGCWKNEVFGKNEKGVDVGGEDRPLSYNIMPLPETADKDGYILKNFRYYERLRVNNDKADSTLAISACAPNRGGQVNQIPHALFYEQQVRFAEGPDQDKVVHVENGTWLWLPRFVQQSGPYPEDSPDLVSPALQQPTEILIAKQIAVPHGNSILALGHIDAIPNTDGEGPWYGAERLPGKPVIPNGDSPFPIPAEPKPREDGTPPPPVLTSILNADERYGTKVVGPDRNFQNPHPQLTLNPNRPLQNAVRIIDPDSYMHWHVTTLKRVNGQGHVTNIPFEQRVSNVIHYFADYWMLSKGDKRYLAYTQTILMNFKIKGATYTFPHITCNTLTYCKCGDDTPAPCSRDAEKK